MSGLASVIGTGIAAGLIGGLAVPATRRWVLGSIQQDWLCHELEFDRIDEDGVTVSLKDGSAFRAFRLQGMLYESRDADYQQRLAISRAAALSQLGDLLDSIRLFGVKRQENITYSGEWPTEALEEIGTAESQKFSHGFMIEWIVILAGRDRRKLGEAAKNFPSFFRDYKPTALARPEDSSVPCPLTRLVHYLVCGSWSHNLSSVYHNISANVPAADLDFQIPGAKGESGAALVTHTPEAQFHAMIGIKSWPEDVSSKFPSQIMAIAGDIELFQVLRPLSADVMRTKFKMQMRQNVLGLFANPTLAGEYAAGMDVLGEGKSRLFETQFQIALRARTHEELTVLVEKVADHLARSRVVYAVETRGMPITWFNRMPGRDQLLRPLKMFSEPAACLWNFAGSPLGIESSPWDKRPVRLFSTPSGQTYRFQFHASATPQSLGHFLVIAPSGSGKSTLVLHLLGGLAKMDGVRSYIFDSKEGTRFMVEALGGTYQGYEKLSLNPLDVGEDTVSNRQLVRQVLISMLGDVPRTPDIEAELDHAISCAFRVDPPDRTLNTIYQPGFSDRHGVKAAMAKWVVDAKGKAGSYAHVFNAEHDSLSKFLGKDFLVGINMNEALSDPVLGAPIVTHIAQAIGRSASQNTQKRGFAIFVDEAARLLENDGFRLTVQEMFREYRKLNGVVGLAFQDPAALHRSGIGEALIENAATLIFFPNPQGKHESYDAFNLEEEELAFIFHGTGGTVEDGGARRVLVVKRDAATDMRESAILDIDLSPYGIAAGGGGLKYYRSGPDAVHLMENLQAEKGDQWRAFL